MYEKRTPSENNWMCWLFYPQPFEWSQAWQACSHYCLSILLSFLRLLSLLNFKLQSFSLWRWLLVTCTKQSHCRADCSFICGADILIICQKSTPRWNVQVSAVLLFSCSFRMTSWFAMIPMCPIKPGLCKIGLVIQLDLQVPHELCLWIH